MKESGGCVCQKTMILVVRIRLWRQIVTFESSENRVEIALQTDGHTLRNDDHLEHTICRLREEEEEKKKKLINLARIKREEEQGRHVRHFKRKNKTKSNCYTDCHANWYIWLQSSGRVHLMEYYHEYYYEWYSLWWIFSNLLDNRLAANFFQLDCSNGRI